MTRLYFSAEIMCWVAENLRPYQFVSDRAFQCLMKTGQPGYYLSHPSTISCDVKVMFAGTRKRITKMLQVSAVLGKLEYDWDRLTRNTMVNWISQWTHGLHPTIKCLSVSLSTWHKMERHRHWFLIWLRSRRLDFCVVLTWSKIQHWHWNRQSHTGENLAEAFANVLDAFGISDKVWNSTQHQKWHTWNVCKDIGSYWWQCIIQWHNGR